MTFSISRKKRLTIFLLFCIIVLFVSYARSILVIPGEITLLEDEEIEYGLNTPFLSNIKADRDGIVEFVSKNIKADENSLNMSGLVSMKPRKNGTVSLNVRLFGFIPIKTMRVDVVSKKELVACGNTVGVKLELDGILVIGISEVETIDGRRVLPTADVGIKPGDLLVEANNSRLYYIEDLVNEIDNSGGKSLRLVYKRNSIFNEVAIKPVRSIDDRKYHIGLWVRDSTAGIGTLTFYDPETKCFGALGHGITDIDTNALMPIKYGEILESNILGIKRGRQGSPGELKGVFIEDKNKLGTIIINNEYGIYGKLYMDAIDRVTQRAYPIGLRNQIKEGPAHILSNIDGKNVEAYEIEIQKISGNTLNGSKGMVIKITDKRLLDATGGIVQGMSGSPIIQEGKIIGAVTHVLVNDPTKGYGIFIEGMLKAIKGLHEEYFENAG